MWNSAPALAVIATWGLWLAAIFATIATAAGLVGGIAAKRESDITSSEAARSIAAANERAEAARLETVRLWNRMAWRRLDAHRRSALITALRGANFSVWTSFVGNDPEATIFRNELDEALQAAGLRTQYFAGWERAMGLKIAANPSPERDRLATAFRSAGLEFTLEEPGQFAPNDIVIIVGNRPEPTR